MGFLRPADRSEVQAPPEAYGWRPYALACSAGFASAMFGYDSAFMYASICLYMLAYQTNSDGYSGGTLSLPSFRRTFGLNATTATALSSHIVSTFQGGAFFGAMLIYPLLVTYGRKPCLLVAGLLFAIGAAIQTGSQGQIGMIYGGRVLTGLGVGSSSLVVPLYISECAIPALRGRLIGIFEIMLQTFLVIGFWINYGVNQNLASTNTQWRITFGFQLVPATFLVIAMLFQPESPRFLCEKGRIEEARKVLSRIRNIPIDHPYISYEVERIQMQLESEAVITGGDRSIMAKIKVIGHPTNWRRLVYGIALQLFQNFSGINALNYYSPNIIKSIGFTGTSVSLLATGIYGIVKAVATMIFMIVGIDRLGRRRALMIGSAGAAFALYYIAIYTSPSASNSFHRTPPKDGGAYFALVAIYLFAIFYAFSWNGIPWIFCAEVFPSGIRAVCIVFTTMAQWLGQFIIAYSFPYMIADMTYGVFIFFGTAVVLGALFVYFFIPETAGISLEEMDILFGVPGLASRKRAETLRIIAEAKRDGVVPEEKMRVRQTEDIEEDGKLGV